jgi:hypothetical protein
MVKPTVYDGPVQRQVQQGDTVCAAEVIPAASSSTALTVTGQMLSQPFIQSNEGGAAAYTVDSAANIILSLSAGLGLLSIQNNTTWRLRHINTTAFVVTYAATANTGVTVSSGVVNASSVKDFLLTVVNGTPQQTYSATTINGSAQIGGLTQAQVATLTPGMIVTSASAGQQGTTILSVNISNGTVTLSGNANATNVVPISYTFSPVVTLTGIGQGLL